MSAVIHHSYKGLPKRFTCGRKAKDGSEWTADIKLVECPQCRAKVLEQPKLRDATEESAR